MLQNASFCKIVQPPKFNPDTLPKFPGCSTCAWSFSLCPVIEHVPITMSLPPIHTTLSSSKCLSSQRSTCRTTLSHYGPTLLRSGNPKFLFTKSFNQTVVSFCPTRVHFPRAGEWPCPPVCVDVLWNSNHSLNACPTYNLTV